MTTIELKNQFQKEIEITPCRFTDDELIEEVRRSVKDAKNGGGKTLAEMRKKHSRI
jgi:hypothetical protein